MLFCRSCGAKINDADRYCGKCGMPIAITVPQNQISTQAYNMSSEREKLLKEIRDNQKKMTEPATARIIKKENDPEYLPLLVGNKLNDQRANTNWAKYEFEVDGKIYYGHAAVHPLHGKRIRIVYNPEDPAQSRSRSSAVIDKMHGPVFILLIAVLIPIIMILVLSFLGIRFW